MLRFILRFKVDYWFTLSTFLFFSFFYTHVFAVSLPAQAQFSLADEKTFRTIKTCPLFAEVSGQIKRVAEIPAKQAIFLSGEILPDKESDKKFTEQLTVQFGNSSGFIAKHCFDLNPAIPINHISLLNAQQGYFITTHKVRIYRAANEQAEVLAELMADLRYPYINLIQNDGQDWYRVQFGDQSGYIAADEVKKDSGIAVLTYHHLLKDEENRHFRRTSTTTSVAAFEKQMALLTQLGYQTITLHELEDYLNGKSNFSNKLIAITFDDGLESVYRYAYPILKKYGLNATIFAISSRVKYSLPEWNPDDLQFITKDQYLEMQDRMDIQSHTHFLHRFLEDQPIILRRSFHNMLVDFRRSIQELKQFNPNVRYLAYPYGSYTSLAKKAARMAGFQLAFSTQIGRVNFGDDRYQLKRIYLLKEDNEQRIMQKLNADYR